MNTAVFVATIKSILEVSFYGTAYLSQLGSNLMMTPGFESDLQMVMCV